MRSVITLEVVSREKMRKRTLRAFKGEEQGSFISVNFMLEAA